MPRSSQMPPSQRRFQCPYAPCPFSAHQGYGLTCHLNSVHWKIRKECLDPSCGRTFSDPSTLSRHVTKHHPEFKPKPKGRKANAKKAKKPKKYTFRIENSSCQDCPRDPPLLTHPIFSPLEHATLHQPDRQPATSSFHATTTPPFIGIVPGFDFDTTMMPRGWGMAESTPSIPSGQVHQEVFSQTAIPCQPSWQSSTFSGQGMITSSATGIVPGLDILDSEVMSWDFGTTYDVPYTMAQNINHPGPAYMPPVSNNYVFGPDSLGYLRQNCRLETQAAFPFDYGAFTMMGSGVTV